ncbi:hypothetical protein BD560DRAFT_423100 [Blakeslea trispora]|nr:hypothetical protein BD560DRAFT_423100 [Blakeslea trispora]
MTFVQITTSKATTLVLLAVEVKLAQRTLFSNSEGSLKAEPSISKGWSMNRPFKAHYAPKSFGILVMVVLLSFEPFPLSFRTAMVETVGKLNKRIKQDKSPHASVKPTVGLPTRKKLLDCK